MSDDGMLRIAAISDVHYSKGSAGMLVDLFNEISATSDVLLLCGDMTDYGLPDEAHILARDLRGHIKIPMLAVLGNHDYESGKPDEVRDVLEQAGVNVLDGECTEIQGVGFVGVRGFAGGFDQYMLSAWGEPAIKMFVQEAMNEELKLESALTRLHTEKKIVLLHYSPIRETIDTEPVEIHAFLGSTRLEQPINRLHAEVAFHGHAHNGKPEGHTSAGIPVYNVSIPVLKRAYPDQHPFRRYEVARPA